VPLDEAIALAQTGSVDTDEWIEANPPPRRHAAAQPGAAASALAGTRRIGADALARGGRAGAEALATTRRAGAGAVAAVKRWSGTTKLIVAGAAAVLLVGTLAIAGDWFGGSDTPTVTAPTQSQPQPTATPPTTPAIDVQVFSERGVTVNVPKGWKRSPGGTYVDFIDPDDRERWVRINITGEKDARRALESAERTFTKSGGFCEPKYERVGLTDTQLAGHPATQLEYLCSPKDRPQRHGIWRVAVVNGSAYHIYLAAPETKYADSTVIFEEMIRSFQLAG